MIRGPSGLPMLMLWPSWISTIGTRWPLTNTPLIELLSTATQWPWVKRNSKCARAISGWATRKSARRSLPTTTSLPGAKLLWDRLDRTVSTGCTGRFINSVPLEPDLPPHDGAVGHGQHPQHRHVEDKNVFRVLPNRVVGRDLLDLDQRWEVDRGRARGIAPTGGCQPRELFETDALIDRDHPAGEHQLRHDRHHQQRHDLLVGLRQGRQQQAEHRRRHTGARHGDEQREGGVAEELGVCGRCALAQP